MIVPSKYQAAIYAAFTETNDNILVEAVAGSGKTHTLVELARIMRERMPERRGCFLAFNKSIATTLQERIGSGGNVVAMTLHSAGWAAWRRAGGLDWTPQLEEHKVSGIIRGMCSWEERKKFEETTRKLVGFAKGVGLVPHDDGEQVVMLGTAGELHQHLHFERESCPTGGPCMRIRGLVPDTDETWDGLIAHYGLDPEECNVALARKVLARSIEIAREKCDYDDMLAMPVIAGVPFEQYDVVLVDEAQDVSGIQMEMMSRMVRSGGRVIAVGDRKQSIYGFRGAGTESMDIMRERFGMRELPLSVSYRCPVAVVQHARQWVGQIEWREGAPDGVVFGEETDWQGQAERSLAPVWVPWQLAPDSDPEERFILVLAADDREEHPEGVLYNTCAEAEAAARVDGISKWKGIADFRPGDAILCRLTRPLIEAAFAIIRERIACRVLGRDIGAGLVGLVKKPKFALDRPVSDWEAWAGRWLPEQCRKLREKRQDAAAGNLEDRAATVSVFVEELRDRGDYAGGDATIGELIHSIEEVFRDRGPEGMVTLATVHKSKGLEWSRVFILDAGRYMPVPWGRQDGWERRQEDNIAYVAATRAARELRYIKSETIGIGRER